MNEREKLLEFSLLGGPMHRLGCRLGLVRRGTDTTTLGLALALFLWTVLVVLAWIEGISHQIFSLTLIGGHVRLLLVIPLFFLCESLVVPLMTTFICTLIESKIVSGTELPALESEIARVGRWKDSWLAEIMCLLLAVLLSLVAPQLHLSGLTATYDPSLAGGKMPLTGFWFFVVCMTLFRFLIFRWLLRLGLWCYLLWRVSKLELHLVPTHPDGVAGLGYLEVVQTEFSTLVVAISAVAAASFAEEISVGRMAFEVIYPEFGIVLLVDAILFLAPLCIFAGKLRLSRLKGLNDYMVLAARYVSDFDRKWLSPSTDPGEQLLGTSDLQSLADLNNSVSIVRGMQMVPGSMRMLLTFVVAAVLPMLPLLLLKYPVDVLAEQLFKSLLGL